MSTPGYWNLVGHRVLVLGATGTIGAAVAAEVARLGGTAVLAGRDELKLSKVRDELVGKAHEILVFDSADPIDVQTVLHAHAHSFGGFSALVCAAGTLTNVPVANQKLKQMQREFENNFYLNVAFIQAFRTKKASWGKSRSVVAVSSIASNNAQAGLTGYAAAKGALESYCRSASKEFVRDNIRVNVIQSGLIHSPIASSIEKTIGAPMFQQHEAQYPLGIGDAADVAQAATFLLMDQSKWITGATLAVDGGYSA